jgi:hypothetical protein
VIENLLIDFSEVVCFMVAIPGLNSVASHSNSIEDFKLMKIIDLAPFVGTSVYIGQPVIGVSIK